MKSTQLDNIRLSAFPEDITSDGLKIYGETSFENQMAVLSHYLHNNHEVSNEKKEEIILAIREFLSRKKFFQCKDEENLTDEEKIKILGEIGVLSEEEVKELIFEVLTPIGYNMMVTPKEIDFVIDKTSEVISNSINKALHKKFDI